MMTAKDMKKPSVAVSLTMPKSLVLAELVKAVDSLNKAAAKLANDYQTVGVQCLMHLKAHGDIGPANRLLAGMPAGMKRNSMGSWMLAHGALSVNQASTRKEAPLSYDKSKKTDPEAAMADPWFNHLPEKPLDEVFDLQKAIHGLLARSKGKTIMLHGQVLSVQHAADALRTLAGLAGETEYVPEVNQVPVKGGRAEDPAADTPKAKADAKRLPTAA